MPPKTTSIDYSKLPMGMDRCGSDSPHNVAYAVRQALEKIDPDKDGRVNLDELPRSPSFDWALELGFLTGTHPAEKKFARLAKATERFKDRFELCSCSAWSSDYGIDGFDLKWLDYRDKVAMAKEQGKPSPSLPQELEPMLCEESGRNFLFGLSGRKYPSLDDLRRGVKFALFQLR